jgi:hypothetical protein
MSIINGTKLNETIADAITFIHTDTASLMALVFACLASLIAFGNIALHLNNYVQPRLQKNVVRAAHTAVVAGPKLFVSENSPRVDIPWCFLALGPGGIVSLLRRSVL